MTSCQGYCFREPCCLHLKEMFSPLIKKLYALYLIYKIGDQDKSWTPYICCSSPARSVRIWLKNSCSSVPFVILMVWKEQKDHISDCYFWLLYLDFIQSQNILHRTWISCLLFDHWLVRISHYLSHLKDGLRRRIKWWLRHWTDCSVSIHESVIFSHL